MVSGDEKQMPPTAFSSRVESDEAELFDGEAPDEDADEEQREAYEDTWNRREIKDCPDLLQLARNAPAQHHLADPLPLGLPRADRLFQRLVLRQPPERAGTPSAGQHTAHRRWS